LAATAMPFAFAGGGLLFAGSRALTALGSPQLLAAGAALLLVAMVGLLGVVDRAAVFTAATVIGLLTVIGAWVASPGLLSGHESAGIVAGAGLAFSPLLHPLAIRLARVPMPVLPRGTADLVRDDPQPPRDAVYAAVVRADGLLTGFVLGLAAVVVPCEILLVRRGGTAPLLLLGLLTAGFLLRARLYPILPQRIAMLAAGGAGLACLALGPLMANRSVLLDVAGPALLVVGATATALGVWHTGRARNPYLGRYAEILEVLVVLAIMPVLSSVLGLYGDLRGLGG
ncbi:MAG TPA: type VII secretion integral membrane protein EccD, partial [Pseudonocardiaceae bacterium]|nr:type VII secretion integral membrane protein EccD [Pseudonocardiaceae bacterium]